MENKQTLTNHLEGLEKLFKVMKENEMLFSKDAMLTLEEKIDTIKEQIEQGMTTNIPNVAELRKSLVLNIIKDYKLYKTEPSLMQQILN